MEISPTERLSFKFISEEDTQFLFELDQDPEVMRFLNGGKPTSINDIKAVFLPRLNNYANQAKGWGLWKVSIHTPVLEDVGWILVRPYGFFSGEPDFDNIELGWRFKRAHWGKGIATEAALQVKKAMQLSGICRFSAIALPQNLASIQIMKKLGMTYSHQEHYQDDVFDEFVVVYSQNLCG